MRLFNFFKKDSKSQQNLKREKIKGIPFGYKNCWFAFRTTDFDGVYKVLKKYLVEIKRTELQTGLKEGWDGNWCLLRPIDGYILLISSNGFSLKEKAIELSEQLGEIHFYSTHRSSNFLACSKFINGRVIRDFAISDGEIQKNEGQPTKIELQIASGYKTSDAIDSSELLSSLGDEEDLMKISGDWSINPSKLDEYEVDNDCIILDLMR